jgi:hypothetical protein
MYNFSRKIRRGEIVFMRERAGCWGEGADICSTKNRGVVFFASASKALIVDVALL